MKRDQCILSPLVSGCDMMIHKWSDGTLQQLLTIVSQLSIGLLSYRDFFISHLQYHTKVILKPCHCNYN